MVRKVKGKIEIFMKMAVMVQKIMKATKRKIKIVLIELELQPKIG